MFEGLKNYFLIILTSAIAISLCATGITWGLPSTIGWAPDEIIHADVTNAMRYNFANGWHHLYPPLQFYFLGVLYKLGFAETSKTFTLFLVNRGLVLAMALGLLAVVYRICRLFSNKNYSLVGVLCVVCSPVFVYYAKIANTDIPSLFWFALSHLYLIKILQNHRVKDYIYYAIFAAFATCTKDQAYGFYILSPLVIVFSLSRASQKSLGQTLLDKRLYAAFFSGFAIFVVIHNWLFNFNGFKLHVEKLLGPASQDYRLFENSFSGHIEMLFQSIRHLDYIWGTPLFCLGIVSLLFVLLKKKNTALNLSLIHLISYYLTFISVIGYNYDRFLLPVTIVLAPFIAYAAYTACTLVSMPKKKILIYFVVLVIGYSALRAASINAMMLNDSRYKAEDWLNANADPRNLIGLIGFRKYLPRHAHFNNRVQAPHELYAFPRLKKKPHFLLHNEVFSRRFSGERDPIGKFFRLLEKGAYGYDKTFSYRTEIPWIVFDPEDYYHSKSKQVYSNLRKVNPQISIYRRNSLAKKIWKQEDVEESFASKG